MYFLYYFFIMGQFCDALTLTLLFYVLFKCLLSLVHTYEFMTRSSIIGDWHVFPLELGRCFLASFSPELEGFLVCFLHVNQLCQLAYFTFRCCLLEVRQIRDTPIPIMKRNPILKAIVIKSSGSRFIVPIYYKLYYLGKVT